MSYELFKPWLIVGGYVVTFVLFRLAFKASDKARATPGSQWRSMATWLYSAGGLVASATTFYWFSLAIDRVVLIVVPAVFALAVFIALRLRRKAQRVWMRRLAERVGGMVCTGNGAQQPSFGVRPRGNLAVSGERGDYQFAVEFDHDGHRVLGIDYTLRTGFRHDDGELRDIQPDGSLVKATRLLNGNYLVQLRTPPMPTLTIRPRTNIERQQQFGRPDPYEMGVLAEMRLARNVTGVVPPGKDLSEIPTGDAGIDRLFTVRAADPAFARAVLVPEVIALLRNEQWFRTGQVTLQAGAVWTNRYGRLTEAALFEATDQLARLVAVISTPAWPRT